MVMVEKMLGIIKYNQQVRSPLGWLSDLAGLLGTEKILLILLLPSSIDKTGNLHS